MAKKKTGLTDDPFKELDRVFHEKARLGILSCLVGAIDGMNFGDLKAVCGLTDGNLNRHLKVLLDSKVLSVAKSGQGRNTNSHYRLTAAGRRAFEQYLEALESIVKKAQENAVAAARLRKGAGKNEGLAGA